MGTSPPPRSKALRGPSLGSHQPSFEPQAELSLQIRFQAQEEPLGMGHSRDPPVPGTTQWYPAL